MDLKILKNTINNLSYTILSNAISVILSVIVTFILPKNLSVENYGHFQLFILYSSYTGFLHFGLVDGILLRFAGKYYEELNKNIFSGQFWLLNFAEILFSIVVCVYSALYMNGEKKIVFFLVGIVIILTIPRYYIQLCLHATNRIKEYATIVLVEKVVFLIGVLICIINRQVMWQFYAVADLIGKLITLIYSCFVCRELVFSKPANLLSSLNEAVKNITPGIKITFAAISSMFIIGFVRISIENQWSVIAFSKASFSFSVSNLLMIFIRAVSLVMFPMLRRTSEDKLSGIYSTMRTCLMVPLLGMLLFYYPLKSVLTVWLPQYADSLKYMAILFPMCVFESKMSMLIETYMKTLRKEKWLLIVNVTTVLLSILSTLITAYWLHNLDLAIMSIVFLLAFRCVIAELLLSTALDVYVKKDILLELGLTVIFICASWFIGGVIGLSVYGVAYVAYLYIKRKDIALVAKTAKNVLRKA